MSENDRDAIAELRAKLEATSTCAEWCRVLADAFRAGDLRIEAPNPARRSLGPVATVEKTRAPDPDRVPLRWVAS